MSLDPLVAASTLSCKNNPIHNIPILYIVTMTFLQEQQTATFKCYLPHQTLALEPNSKPKNKKENGLNNSKFII